MEGDGRKERGTPLAKGISLTEHSVQEHISLLKSFIKSSAVFMER